MNRFDGIGAPREKKEDRLKKFPGVGHQVRRQEIGKRISERLKRHEELEQSVLKKLDDQRKTPTA